MLQKIRLHASTACLQVRAAFGATYDFFSVNPFGLSLTELLFTLFVSNAAIWFIVFTYMVDTKGAELTFATAWDVVSRNFVASEILVYLLALIAPALWIMAHNWRARKHVGFYWTLLLIQAVIVVGSAYIYGRAKSGDTLNSGFVAKWAVICLVAGIVILYITLVYKRTVISRVEAPPLNSGQAILDDLNAGRNGSGT